MYRVVRVVHVSLAPSVSLFHPATHREVIDHHLARITTRITTRIMKGRMVTRITMMRVMRVRKMMRREGDEGDNDERG